MKARFFLATLSLMSGLAGCESLDARRIDAKLDAQTDALNRIERQNSQILNQLQAHESAIKTLEPQTSALVHQQAVLQCMVLSERAHSKCMSLSHTLTDNVIYLDQMQKCLRKDPQYRDDLAACQREDAKPQ